MNLKLYTPLSIINFLLLLYVIGTEFVIQVIIFFLGILLNQYMLLRGVQSILSENQKKSYFLIIKLFILILVFIFAGYTMQKHLMILTFSYIFQLIILVLSIKRNR